MLTQVNPLMVLGMHRSGTSVLAGCLHILGIELGTDMMPANARNEIGYWENENLMTIHEVLLRQLGCSWDMVGSLPADWLESAAGQKAKQRLKSFLDRTFRTDKLWAVKDPRLSMLFPLWAEVLEQRNEKPGLIVIVRHPDEVAASLAKRDTMDIRKGLLLWFAYNRETFAACRARPHVVITYDQLLGDPLATLDTIEKKLGINYPKSLQDNIPAILSFVSTDLKHEHRSPRKYPGEGTSSYFSALYENIRCLAADQNIAKPQIPISPDGEAVPENGQESLSPLLLITEPAVSNKDEQPDLPNREYLRATAPQLFDRLFEHIGLQEREWLSQRMARERRVLTSTAVGSTLFAVVFFPSAQGETYADQFSETFLLDQEGWQELTCVINNPEGLAQHGLRIDPLNTKGVAFISEIQILNMSTRETLARFADPADFKQIRAGGHAVVIPDQKHFTIWSFDCDPQIYLPPLAQADSPLELRIWIKVQTNQEPLRKIWAVREQALAETLARLSAVQENAQTAAGAAAARIQELEGQLLTAASEAAARIQELEMQLLTAAHEMSAVQENAQTAAGAAAARIQELEGRLLTAASEMSAVQENAQTAAGAAAARIQELEGRLLTAASEMSAVQENAQTAAGAAAARIQELEGRLLTAASEM
ncbi:hypothetical protein G3N56_14505, partial [Desulfovibrio sulfodismutans]